MKRFPGMALVAATIVIAAGCGDSSARDATITRLEANGLSKAQATCLVDAAERAGVPLDTLDPTAFASGSEGSEFPEEAANCMDVVDSEDLLQE